MKQLRWQSVVVGLFVLGLGTFLLCGCCSTCSEGEATSPPANSPDGLPMGVPDGNPCNLKNIKVGKDSGGLLDVNSFALGAIYFTPTSSTRTYINGTGNADSIQIVRVNQSKLKLVGSTSHFKAGKNKIYLKVAPGQRFNIYSFNFNPNSIPNNSSRLFKVTKEQ